VALASAGAFRPMVTRATESRSVVGEGETKKGLCFLSKKHLILASQARYKLPQDQRFRILNTFLVANQYELVELV
jgi:hypothetical protein